MKINGEQIDEKKKKMKDPNRGFKTDISGKLIIEEQKRGGKDDDTESDDDMDEENVDTKKKISSENSDSDDDEVTENARAKLHKRKANSSLSQVSGRTGASDKYVTGGKGMLNICLCGINELTITHIYNLH